MTSLYAWHVNQGTGTFETEAPSKAELSARRAEILRLGLPWLVAEQAGELRGYAYANQFRARAAFRFCVEDSVYVAEEARGLGVGKLLLGELIARCQQAGARQMLAVIGDAANLASVGMHRALGFEPAGALKSVGWKFGEWRDVVMMQRSLGLGARTPATEAV